MMGTWYIHWVSGETKVICTMNQYSLKNQGPTQKKLTETEKLEFYHCVTKCCSYYNPSKILAYTTFQILPWSFSLLSQTLKFILFVSLQRKCRLLACWLLHSMYELVLVVSRGHLCANELFQPCKFPLHSFTKF